MGRIKIAIPIYDPWTTACSVSNVTLQRTKECQKPGFCNEILGYMLEAMGWKAGIDYEILPLGYVRDWGSLMPNGTEWTGLLGHLQNGTIDMISCCYTPNLLRMRSFDVTQPVTQISGGYVLRLENDISKQFFTLFNVLPGSVWRLFLICCALIAIMLAANNRLFEKHEAACSERKVAFEEPASQSKAVGKGKSLAAYLAQSTWSVVSFITDQYHESYSTFHKVTLTTRLLLTSCGFLAIFTIIFYESALLSALFRDTHYVPFRTADGLADLIASGKYAFMDKPGSNFLNRIAASEKGDILWKLKLAIAENPVVENSMSIPERVKAINADPTLVTVIGEMTFSKLSEKYCGLYFVAGRELAGGGGALPSFILRKNQTDLRKRLNYHMNSNYPFMEQIVGRYRKVSGKPCEDAAGPQTLKLSNFLPVYITIATLMAIGAVILFVEIGLRAFLEKCGQKNSAQQYLHNQDLVEDAVVLEAKKNATMNGSGVVVLS